MSERVYTVLFMAAVAAAFTAGVSGVSLMSRERIRLNERLSRRRLQMEALGIQVPEDATLQEVAALYEERMEETELSYEDGGTTYPLLAGRSADGRRLGYVFETVGSGLWGPIHGYLAVNPEGTKTLGVAFFEHSETPGLGGEITRDWFKSQFRGLELPPGFAEGEQPVELKAPSAEHGPYDVDAITGATQTSNGVEAMLNSDLRAVVKLLREQK
ncbi:MAG: FMN-binding protein [Planctomycetota bacterium]